MKQRFFISILFCVFLVSFVGAAGNLSGALDASSKSNDPGQTVSFTLTLTNSGSSAISSITITSSSLSDGSGHTISAPSISKITSLGNSTSQNVSFSITLPATPAGTYSGTITATDDANSANNVSLAYSAVVNSKDILSIDTSDLSFDIVTGDSTTKTFTVKNDGSTTLSSWSINFTSEDGDANVIEDNDGDQVSFSFSNKPTSLSPGSSATVSVVIDSDSAMDPSGNYAGDISISSTGSSTQTKTIAVTVAVQPDICEEGEQGSDYDVSIVNPEDNDNFEPGDTMQVEVDVENKANDDLDTVVEVTLYDKDEGEKIKTVKESRTVNEDETETFEIDLELPSDLDEKDDYLIYVQVHEDGNEDDSCTFEDVSIDIERSNEAAQLSSISVTPETGLKCGEDYRISTTAESLGTDSIENLYMTITDDDLKLDSSSENFDLGDYNDDDNSYKKSFDVAVPEDLDEGTYYFDTALYTNSGDLLDSQLTALTIELCKEEVSTNLDVAVSDEYTVVSDKLTLGLTVKNNGADSADITITPETVSWATLTGSEYLTSIPAGEEIHAYLYFTLDSATTGKHNMEITTSDQSGAEISKIVTVDFGEVPVAEKEEAFFDKLGSSFTQGSNNAFWVIADIVLVILALVFLKMLFSRKGE